MKKLLLCAVLGVLAAGCASSQKQASADNTASDSYSKYQIVDQEFENFTVKNDGYDKVLPYEEQISSSSYIQSAAERGTQKPARTMEKTVVNGQGQALSVKDQEVLPDGAAQ